MLGSDWQKRPRAVEAIAYTVEPPEKHLGAMVREFGVY